MAVTKKSTSLEKKAWVIAVDMGYGHARAAYPLQDIAKERIITANNDKIVSKEEQKLWKESQNSYEWFSRISELPIIGKYIWKFFDTFQSIEPRYPEKDLSRPTISTFFQNRLIRKGLCKSLLTYISRIPLPIITTFFSPALAASLAGLPNIYCVATDTDINRSWVAVKPKESNITYFAPTKHAARRLLQYGVPREKVILSGFPLPKESLGGITRPITKKDLSIRLANLDPRRKYLHTYQSVIEKALRPYKIPSKPTRPLTIMYAVGGAGAQKGIVATILQSLKSKLDSGEVRLVLGAGIRLDVISYFRDLCKQFGNGTCEHTGITIISALSKNAYFEAFNEALHTTDILWTKPSEMAFYTALGLPIIIAPPLGSHEVFNEKWLRDMGAGYVQEDPRATASWLFDLINDGMLAEAAWEGFLEAPYQGTYIIEDIVTGKKPSTPVTDEELL